MHQFFVTLFALLLSLGHHAGVASHSLEAQVDEIATPSSLVVLPERHQLARVTAQGGYADNACVSCRRIDSFSSDR